MKFLETKIEFLKLWITFFITMEVGTFAWFFNNFGKIEYYKMIIALAGIFIIFIPLGVITKKCYKLIKEMKRQENTP